MKRPFTTNFKKAAQKAASMLAMTVILTGAIGLAPDHSQAAAVFKPTDVTVNIEVSTGTLIRFDKPANNVFIADPEVADIQVKSPRLVYVFGKKPGATTLYAVSANDEVLFSGTIQITHNVSQLNAALKQMSPDLSVDVREVNGMLVLTGEVQSPEEANDVQALALKLVGKDQQVVNRLNIATPTQVNLRVRIAEVSRDVTKQLGFNWEGGIGIGSSFLGLQNAADVFEFVSDKAGSFALPVVPGDTVPGFLPTVPMPTPYAAKPTRQFFTDGKDSGSYVGSLVSGKVDLNAIIDALDVEGFLTVLAEPNLTALSGQHASFLAGGEFPIPIPQENGVIAVDYRQFGVGLQFTPTVLSSNKINLKVQPEVSQLSAAGAITLGGFNIPALSMRRAETVVELGSGQSFAIGGLLQDNINRESQKFPGLGDLPILGALFRSDRFQRQETELIIIVTPYIVRPVSAKRMPLPMDGLVMPNDKERYLDGQTYRAVPRDDTRTNLDNQATPAATPAGFMLN